MSQSTHHFKAPSHRKRRILLFLAIFFLFASITYVLSLEDIAEIQPDDSPPPLPVVRYQLVHPKTITGVLTRFAEVMPRWQVTLKANVSGKIVEVFPEALTGEHVALNTPLIQIENSAYTADLRMAEHALAQAQLERDKARNRTTLARAQWLRVHPEEIPTDTVLHLPDLRVADLAILAAQAKVASAKITLNATNVRAPFSGYITERFINIGQSITPGDSLVTILHDETLDIDLSLSEQDWELLDPDWAGRTVAIRNDTGQEIGRAQLRRGGGFLDPKTRQYRIFLQVLRNEANSVLAGEFVKVDLPGRAVENSLRIREGALTRDGFVWHIDKENRLRRVQAEPVFRQDKDIIIPIPPAQDAIGTWKVVLTPLASFIPGMMVSPLVAEE